MVNVLVVADEVASYLPERTLRDISPDLVLAAGDLPWDYLEWLASSVDAQMVFVPGNHDPEIGSARQRRNGTWTDGGLVCDGPRPHGFVNADQGGRGSGRAAHRRTGRVRGLQARPQPVQPA